MNESKKVCPRATRYSKLEIPNIVAAVLTLETEIDSDHTYGDYEAVMLEASNEDSNWLDVSNLTDEEIGLFPCDREELDRLLADEKARARELIASTTTRMAATIASMAAPTPEPEPPPAKAKRGRSRARQRTPRPRPCSGRCRLRQRRDARIV